MLADIASPDKYIKANDLKEVTSGALFTSQTSIPDENGLVSYEIFGNPGTIQRKKTFAYIDLGDTFIHPMAYDCLIMLDKKMVDVLNGVGYYYVDGNGHVVKVDDKSKAPEKVDCSNGAKWLKRNIKKINFNKPQMTATRKDRVNFITSLQEDEMFITKWLVIPAYYRDVDIHTDKKNDINIMYQGLISQAKAVKAMSLMFKSDEVTDSHIKIQTKLGEIYRYFTTFLGGTKSFIQKHVLGKAPDYSARMVISTSTINSDSPDEMNTDYAHTACPLSMVLECFEPFIEYGFKNFVKNQINGSDYVYTKSKDGTIQRIPLASHWEQCLLHDAIHDLIKLYTDSKEHRLDYFTVEAEDGSMIPLGYIISNGSIHSSDNEIVEHPEQVVRPITLCEMFYMIAMDTCKNKQVMVTRFPIEDYQNVYPSMMNIIPYSKTKRMTINGTEYPRFPDISLDDIRNKLETNVGEKFNDTLELFPTYLKALGADFDGDTVTVQGIFTEKDPMEYINSPMNIINIAGDTMRSISDVNAQVLFAMTRLPTDN